MATCDKCGKEENLPYNCGQCGRTFCSEHRLPENHDCPGLDQWNDPGGVFDSGFDDSVNTQGGSGSVLDKLGIDTGVGGPLGYFRGNMTFVFLAIMWLTFAVQMFVRLTTAPTGDLGMFDPSLYFALFTLDPSNPHYVWTWITSIFSHSGFGHIAVNSIVIYFFGRLVEDYIGSRDFALLFVVSGVIAGLGQMLLGILTNDFTPGLGASGAGLAIMGVLTILNPNLRVYVWMILPMPIWVLTALFAAYSVFMTGLGGVGAGGVGHIAHLLGLAIGLLYGNHVKDRIRTPNQVQFGGGGRGPGGPGGPGRGRF